MTLDEAIKMYTSNAEYERTHGSLQGCLEFRQLAEWLKELKQLKEQEPCEDEYIKVPKKALKYRTAGMVAYNAEWLKDHFDIERAVICGAQQSYDDAISRQAVLDQTYLWSKDEFLRVTNPFDYLRKRINSLQPVKLT